MGELIERLNDAWRRLYADGDEHGVCDTIAEAAAALEAAREDAVCAERYRWLRCGGWEVMQDPKYGRPELRFDGAIDAGRVAVALDAAIDQARGKGGQEVGVSTAR